jgi:hypothetical protein
LVSTVWSLPHPSINDADIWQNKLKSLRKKIKGWAINIEASNKKNKQDLMLEYDILGVFSEENPLSNLEIERMETIKNQINEIWQQEETKAWQRSRDRHILEGDKNTSYFHALANQRRRKKHLAILDGPNGPVSKTKDMLGIAIDFYKNLFSREDRPNISLSNDFWDEEDL